VRDVQLFPGGLKLRDDFIAISLRFAVVCGGGLGDFGSMFIGPVRKKNFRIMAPIPARQNIRAIVV